MKPLRVLPQKKVILHPDQSIEVTDNGRGMPVDHSSYGGVSGVEVILTKLHAGGKFSIKNMNLREVYTVWGFLWCSALF